ncbi:hypothetical protein [Rothia nasimurium]|uniref:hypothetical protein n=1 Tax=Rothia nasimurium TaxID=85336 RepID=UPI003BA3BA11
MDTTSLSPSEQETVTTLEPLMLALFKALNVTGKTITRKQAQDVSTHIVNAYMAGQAAGWDEGYADGRQDGARASLIAAGLREAHTNPHRKEPA